MKMLRFLAGILLVAGFLFSSVSFGSGVHAAIAPTSSAVEIYWTTAKGYGVGSGVYIGNGLIVTARHVVRDATGYTMVVTDQAGERVIASPQWSSPTTDVEMIRLQGQLAFAGTAALDKRAPVKGESITVIGCPYGHPFVVTYGQVTGQPQNPFPEWRDAIPINAEVHPGNSGGPAYDAQGEVLGIVVGEIHDKQGHHITNIMISAREVAG